MLKIKCSRTGAKSKTSKTIAKRWNDKTADKRSPVLNFYFVFTMFLALWITFSVLQLNVFKGQTVIVLWFLDGLKINKTLISVRGFISEYLPLNVMKAAAASASAGGGGLVCCCCFSSSSSEPRSKKSRTKCGKKNLSRHFLFARLLTSMISHGFNIQELHISFIRDLFPVT